MIHENSKIANDSIAESKPSAMGQVFSVIHSRGCVTRQDIAASLGWEINRVTGRVKELLSTNMIEECGTVKVDGRPRALLRIARREAA